MTKKGRAPARAIWALAALLGGDGVETGVVASPQDGEFARNDETAQGGEFARNVETAQYGEFARNVETTRGALSLPDPGDDWILLGKSEDEEKKKTRSALACVAAVGRIVAVDASEIETEDRRRDRRERTPKRPGDAILFLPPVDPSAAEAFCGEIREATGAPNRDRFWLRNGDEFDGELLKIDRRRVWIRAFDVEFAVPRGRVRAVRFAENVDDNDKKGEKGEK